MVVNLKGLTHHETHEATELCSQCTKDNYKFHAYRISDLRPTEREGFWAILNRGQGVPSKANCRIASGLGTIREFISLVSRSAVPDWGSVMSGRVVARDRRLNGTGAWLQESVNTSVVIPSIRT